MNYVLKYKRHIFLLFAFICVAKAIKYSDEEVKSETTPHYYEYARDSGYSAPTFDNYYDIKNSETKYEDSSSVYEFADNVLDVAMKGHSEYKHFLLLFLLAITWAFWFNQHKADIYLEFMGAVLKDHIRISAKEPPSLFNEGKLITFSENAVIVNPPQDTVFGIECKPNWIALKMTKQMYLWKETKNTSNNNDTRTTYTYSCEWSSTYINSYNFYERFGHENPPAEPNIGVFTYLADGITLGHFTISQGQMKTQLINAYSTVPIPAGFVSNIQRENWLVKDNMFQRVRNPNFCSIGDVCVKFEAVTVDNVTVLGQQHEGTIIPYKEDKGKVIALMNGIFTVPKIIEKLKKEKDSVVLGCKIFILVALAVGLFLYLNYFFDELGEKNTLFWHIVLTVLYTTTVGTAVIKLSQIIKEPLYFWSIIFIASLIFLFKN